MKTKQKQKSLGQVAFEAACYPVCNLNKWRFLSIEEQADWHRVARAVVNTAKQRKHT